MTVLLRERRYIPWIGAAREQKGWDTLWRKPCKSWNTRRGMLKHDLKRARNLVICTTTFGSDQRDMPTFEKCCSAARVMRGGKSAPGARESIIKSESINPW